MTICISKTESGWGISSTFDTADGAAGKLAVQDDAVKAFLAFHERHPEFTTATVILSDE